MTVPTPLPKKRTFRRTGRPQADENPLLAYAKEAPTEAIRLLIGVAARRPKPLTLKALAKLCDDRDPRALAKTILAKRPQAYHVKSLASALDFPAAVGRALTNELSVAECRAVLRETIADEIAQRFGSGVNAAAIVGVGLTHEALGLADDALLEAGRVAALARSGAFDLDGSDDTLLGPVLGPLEIVLQLRGFTLRAIIGDEAALRVRTLEGFAAFAWLRDVFGVTDAQTEEVRRIVPRLAEADNLAMTAPEYERFRLGVRAAKRAFDNTFHRGAGADTLQEAAFGGRGSHERKKKP